MNSHSNVFFSSSSSSCKVRFEKFKSIKLNPSISELERFFFELECKKFYISNSSSSSQDWSEHGERNELQCSTSLQHSH